MTHKLTEEDLRLEGIARSVAVSKMTPEERRAYNQAQVQKAYDIITKIGNKELALFDGTHVVQALAISLGHIIAQLPDPERRRSTLAMAGELATSALRNQEEQGKAGKGVWIDKTPSVN